jgi:hypothetical protein
VFSSDAACPFCGAALEPVAVRAETAREDRMRGLSRAQRASLAAAAVSAQLLLGCEEPKAIAVYGAPWDPDSGFEDEDASTPES